VHTTAANAYAPGAQPPDETAPLYPAERAAFYLTSKVAQEIFAAHWAARHGMSVTALRLSALYGAGQERGLFTSFARKLLAGEPVRLANGGSYGADFLTLDDAAAAVLLFLESGASGSFNIASGSRSTLKDAASLLLEMTGANAEQLVLEPSTHSDPGFPAIAIDKAGTQGFSPTGIREGLRQLVDWVRSGTPARAA
jgi:UDP-glucose 4-epimerase